MVDDPALQWILTILFTATAIVSALGMLRRPRGLATVGHASHLLMSLVMVAMCWPWWFALPYIPQLVAFSVAVLWYLGLVIALLLPTTHAAVHARGEPHGVWHQTMHAVMAGAMVWMLAAMAGGGSDGGHQHHALSTGTALSGIALVAGLIVCVVVMGVDLASDGVRRPRDRHRVDMIAAAAMCAGMAGMCWPMIAG